ncbi:hypothetical protein GCM10010176_066800 [Nonomuraea spiralis]|nr:hypothetical protein GCM10010176_066800 [Nonomuraea spiralis]
MHDVRQARPFALQDGRQVAEHLPGLLPDRGADDLAVDTSRPGARRWCAMERCGNRHKLRALRARQAMES